MDRIVYSVIDELNNRIIYATFDYLDANTHCNNDENYLIKKEIVDINDRKVSALKKLDEIDKLILGLTKSIVYRGSNNENQDQPPRLAEGSNVRS